MDGPQLRRPVVCCLALLLLPGPVHGQKTDPASVDTGFRVTESAARACREVYLGAGHEFRSTHRGQSTAQIQEKIERTVARMYESAGESAPTILKEMIRSSGAGRLSPEDSHLMWRVRQSWFDQAIREICLERGVSVGLLDSGTEGSAENDSDKSVNVMSALRESVSEAEFIQLVTQRVPEVIARRTGVKGISLTHLDIEMFSGRDRYPSWRSESAPAEFKTGVLDVLSRIGHNDQAYLTDAAIQMQVIRRAQEKDRDLRTGAAGAEHGAAFQLYEALPDGQGVAVSSPDDWLERLAISGDLDLHDSLGSALGNHIMLAHKLANVRAGHARPADIQNDVAKYTMRALLDTRTVMDPERLQKLERYGVDEFPDEMSRRRLISDLTGIDPVAADANEARRLDQYRMAMDVSAQLLANKQARAAIPRQPTADDARIYHDLAVAAAGSPRTFAAATREQKQKYLDQARQLYVDIADELSVRVMAHTAPDAVRVWLDPHSDPRMKKFRAGLSDTDNRKYRILASILLKTTFERIDEKHRARILNSIPDEYRVEAENMLRMVEWKQRKSARKPEPPGRVRRAMAAIGNRLRISPPDPRRPFNGSRMQWAVDRVASLSDPATRQRVRGFVEANRAQWRASPVRRFLLSEATDMVGNVDAVLGLIDALQRAEHLSPQEQEAAFRAALWNEAFSRIPYLGTGRGLAISALDGNYKAVILRVTPILERFLRSRGFTPGPAGVVLLYVNLSRTFVAVIGHEVFFPLRRDAIDLVYKGYMEDTEAGLLRAGRHLPEGFEPSQFPSITVAFPAQFAMLDSRILEWLLDEKLPVPVRDALSHEMEPFGDAEPTVIVDLERDWAATGEDLRQRIHQLAKPIDTDALTRAYRAFQVQELSTVLRAWDRQHVLATWLRDQVRRDAAGKRIQFEVRRQNAYRYLQARVDAAWSATGHDPRRVEEILRDFTADLNASKSLEDEAQREQLIGDIRSWRARVEREEREAAGDVFMGLVQDWTNATGPFSDYPENTALEFVWHDEETRRALVDRLAENYQSSRLVTLAAEPAIQALRDMERSVGRRIDEQWNRALAEQLETTLEPDADLLARLASALAPEPEAEPRVDLTVVIQEAAPEPQMIFEVDVTADPVIFGSQWRAVGGLAFRKVDTSAVPAEHLQRLDPAGDDELFEVSIEIGGFESGVRRGTATGRTWIALRRAQPRFDEPDRGPVESDAEPPDTHPRVLYLAEVLLVDRLKDSETPVQQGVSIEGSGGDGDGHQISLTGGLQLHLPGSITLGQPFEVGMTADVSADVKLLDDRKRTVLRLTGELSSPNRAGTSDDFLETATGYQGTARGRIDVRERWEPIPRNDPEFGSQLIDPNVAAYRLRRVQGHPSGISWRQWTNGELTHKPDTDEQIFVNWEPEPDDGKEFRGKLYNAERSFDFKVKLFGVGNARTDDPDRGVFDGRFIKSVHLIARYYATKSPLPAVPSYSMPALSAGSGASGVSREERGDAEVSGELAGRQPRRGNPFSRSMDAAIGAEQVARDSDPGAATGTGAPGSATATGGASPGASTTHGAALSGGEILALPRPWQHERVQGLMDDWTGRATPALPAVPGGSWRYTDWGVAWNGVTVLRPDHPPAVGRPRHQWLWEQADGLSSQKHGTLREYVESKLLARTLAARRNPFDAAADNALGPGPRQRGAPSSNPFEEAASGSFESPGRDTGNPWSGQWSGRAEAVLDAVHRDGSTERASAGMQTIHIEIAVENGVYEMIPLRGNTLISGATLRPVGPGRLSAAFEQTATEKGMQITYRITVTIKRTGVDRATIRFTAKTTTMKEIRTGAADDWLPHTIQITATLSRTGG